MRTTRLHSLDRNAPLPRFSAFGLAAKTRVRSRSPRSSWSGSRTSIAEARLGPLTLSGASKPAWSIVSDQREVPSGAFSATLFGAAGHRQGGGPASASLAVGPGGRAAPAESEDPRPCFARTG